MTPTPTPSPAATTYWKRSAASLRTAMGKRRRERDDSRWT
jgi:hypothetical protein